MDEQKERAGVSYDVSIDWDEDTRKVIEKDQADEDGHVNRWRTLLREERT